MMIRKKAINDFITACQEQGFSDALIVDQLEFFVTNTMPDHRIQLVKILEEGEVID